jgi:hypothetical protein
MNTLKNKHVRYPNCFLIYSLKANASQSPIREAIMKIIYCLLLAPLIVGMYPSQGHAASWSGIIDPSRAIDWSTAGVAGGIPNRTTICATLNPGATISQINNAIANCPEGQVVFLNAGTYNLGSGMLQLAKNNVTVRGAGANQTKLYFTGRGNCGGVPSVLCISSNGWIQGGYVTTPQTLANWTAGYAKDSSVLMFSSTSGLTPGARVILEQLNDTADNAGVYVCGTGGKCGYASHGGDTRGDRFQRQIVTVASVNGTQVTIDQPLHMPNWRSDRSPTARWGASTVSGSGYEDLSIDLRAASITSSQSNIGISGAKNSWLKGIRSVQGDRSHAQIYQSVGITIRDSYFYGIGSGESTSYGIETYSASSNLLIENNMFQHVTNPLIINDGGSGSVFGYNYSIDNYRSTPTDLMVATFQVHSPGTGMILIEGNDGLAAAADNWYGTVHFVTMLRNHLYGDIYNNPVKSSQTWIMQIAAYSRFFNFIGNVLGRSGYYSAYESSNYTQCGAKDIWCLGYSHATGSLTDAETKPRAMRWGNYDTVTGTSRFLANEVPSGLSQFANPVPANQNLPASFYLASKPSFFKDVAWPAVGPDVTSGNISGYAGHANKIPARLCWENSTIDSAYGSLNIRLFDSKACYTGSASSLAPPYLHPL